jgi:NADPH:quinone reductase-like Zn-dependent oxidoreductase
VDNGHVSAGQKVFINGGSGGIGVIAIQIAKSLGAYVATTVSTDNVEFAKSLGADEVIDYKTTDYTEVLKDYNVALNNVYSDKINEVLSVLKDGAIAVSLAGNFDEAAAKAKNITATAQMTNVSTASLNELAGMVGDDEVKPIVSKTFTLDQVAKAFDEKQNGSVRGKIVIAIR